jgi:hypothetical protein
MVLHIFQFIKFQVWKDNLPYDHLWRIHFIVLYLCMIGFQSTSGQTAIKVKSFSIQGSGSGPRMRMGDLNGDGRLDFLMVQATDETPSEVQMLTAYNGFNGERLWQIGADNNLTGTDRDEPAQIWDIDNDGGNEVIAVMKTKLLFLNGATGTIEKEMDMPSGYTNAHDCIIFANFSKKSIAQDMVLKDRYDNAVAIDIDGNRLWTYRGITGHYPWPFDIDGDGRDEFFIGYSCLDYQGKQKYQAPITVDHPDCIWIGDVDADASNGWEVVYGLASSPSTRMVRISNGKVVWTNSDRRESQQVMLADFRKDKPGLETYGLDRVNRTDQDALFVIDAQGKQLWEETPDKSGYMTAIKLVRNWDGTKTPLCLAFKRGGSVSPELRDGNGKIVATIPGEVASNACIGDFGGDDKQEILMYSVSTASIYAVSQFDYALPSPQPGKPLKQPKEYANYSRYGSGDPFALENGATAAVSGRTVFNRQYDSPQIHRVLSNRLPMACPGSTHTRVIDVYDLFGKRIISREIGPGGEVVDWQKLGVYHSQVFIVRVIRKR